MSTVHKVLLLKLILLSSIRMFIFIILVDKVKVQFRDSVFVHVIFYLLNTQITKENNRDFNIRHARKKPLLVANYCKL